MAVRLPPVEGALAKEEIGTEAVGVNDVFPVQEAARLPGRAKVVAVVADDQSSPEKPASGQVRGPRSPLVEKRLIHYAASKRPAQLVVSRMQEDAVRHLEFVSHRRFKDDAMLGSIAQMKHNLRGDFLAKVPLLSVCPWLQSQLVGKLRPWHYVKGKLIISEGEVGDKMYIIERGLCEVIKTVNSSPIIMGYLGKGAFFGEMGVMVDVPRTATVVANTDVTLLSLSRDDLGSIVGDSDLEKMQVVARTQIFYNVPMLAKLSAEHKVSIAQCLKVQEWAQGAVLAGELHTTVRLVIIEEGKVLMQVRDPQSLPNFMTNASKDFQGIVLGPGQYFGMRGLLFDAPVGFTVTAVTDKVTTMSLTQEDILSAAQTPSEREELSQSIYQAMRSFLLSEVPQLRRLPDFHFEEVLRHVENYQVKKWEVVFTKGQQMDAIYVLEQGKLVMYEGDVAALKDLIEGDDFACKECQTPGEYFGTDCLTKPQAIASCTLVALTDVTLLRVPPDAVRKVMEEERQQLSKVPIFADNVLTREEQFMLVGQLMPWNFKQGHHLIREGELGDKLFFIEQGVCDILKKINGRDTVVGHLKKGNYVGEVSVLYDAPRTATVSPATEVTAVSLSRNDLLNVLPPGKIDKIRKVARTQVFQTVPILSELSAATRVRIAERMLEEAWKLGDRILAEKDTTQHLRIVEHGEVRMEVSDPTFILPGQGARTSVHRSGSHFGGMGLLSSMPAAVTVSAETEDVTTLSISLEEILACAEPGEAESVFRAMRGALHSHLLSRVPRFAAVRPEQIKTMLGYMEEKEVEKGTVILPRDSVVSSLYMLESGRLAEVNLTAAEVEEGGSSWQSHVLAEKAVVGYYYDKAKYEEPLPFSVVAAENCCILCLSLPDDGATPTSPLARTMTSLLARGFR